MSSTDFHEFVRISSGKTRLPPKAITGRAITGGPIAGGMRPPATRPNTDVLGVSLLAMHLSIGGVILFGWAIPNANALLVYDVFVPLVMAQWAFNEGSCILNNVESRLRFGRWRTIANPEEGGFVRMLSIWWFGYCPTPLTINAASYAAASTAWLLGIAHLYWVSA